MAIVMTTSSGLLRSRATPPVDPVRCAASCFTRSMVSLQCVVRFQTVRISENIVGATGADTVSSVYTLH